MAGKSEAAGKTNVLATGRGGGGLRSGSFKTAFYKINQVLYNATKRRYLNRKSRTFVWLHNLNSYLLLFDIACTSYISFTIYFPDSFSNEFRLLKCGNVKNLHTIKVFDCPISFTN